MSQIKKSSRLQHIAGRFGEYMLCAWLSQSGFEVAIAKHTGLDLEYKVEKGRRDNQRGE